MVVGTTDSGCLNRGSLAWADSAAPETRLFSRGCSSQPNTLSCDRCEPTAGTVLPKPPYTHTHGKKAFCYFMERLSLSLFGGLALAVHLLSIFGH